jgi:hypothetical protein
MRWCIVSSLNPYPVTRPDIFAKKGKSQYMDPQKKKTEHGESKPMKNWTI